MGAWWSEEVEAVIEEAETQTAVDSNTADSTTVGSKVADSKVTDSKVADSKVADSRVALNNGIFLITTFHDNGKKATMFTEYDGNKHGEYKEWNEDGRLITKIQFNYGEKLTEHSYVY
jgi:antitoxin component YwqK of YwqJK toxin-antitoxin module